MVAAPPPRSALPRLPSSVLLLLLELLGCRAVHLLLHLDLPVPPFGRASAAASAVITCAQAHSSLDSPHCRMEPLRFAAQAIIVGGDRHPASCSSLLCYPGVACARHHHPTTHTHAAGLLPPLPHHDRCRQLRRLILSSPPFMAGRGLRWQARVPQCVLLPPACSLIASPCPPCRPTGLDVVYIRGCDDPVNCRQLRHCVQPTRACSAPSARCSLRAAACRSANITCTEKIGRAHV